MIKTFSLISLLLFITTVYGNIQGYESKPFCMGDKLFIETIKDNITTKKIFWDSYDPDMCYEFNKEIVDYCELCQNLITELQTAVETQEVRIILEYLCNELPSPTNKVCLMSLDKIIAEFQTVDPVKFCKWVQLCH